jgi:hypothetical protein
MRLLAFAIVLAFLSIRPAHSADTWGEKVGEAVPEWMKHVAHTCDDLRLYLQSHTEDEARAEAVRLNFPKWLIRKAEACPRAN